MKKIVLALVAVNMAASAMAVELERVDLAALNKMELPAVSAEGIKAEKAVSTAKSSVLGPRYVVYTAAGGAVVTADQDAGLLWITNPNAAGMGGTYNWPDAVKVCENLAYAGYRDWRLPTVDELRSALPAYENPGKPLVSEYFLNTRMNGYWSADTYEPYPATAYDFSFYFKKEGTFNKTGYLYVRCVRGGV